MCQSISLFVATKHTDGSTQVQVMTTYEKHLYGVTSITQGADAPRLLATHVLKTQVEYIYSTMHKKTPKREKQCCLHTCACVAKPSVHKRRQWKI